MKLVYTHENIALVKHYQNVLENEGMETLIKNQFLSGAAGELGLNDVWPELWVLDDRTFEQAKTHIEKANIPNHVASWLCPNCKEENSGAFELCWQCQTPAPDDEG